MPHSGHRRVECSCGRIIETCRCLCGATEVRQHPACRTQLPILTGEREPEITETVRNFSRNSEDIGPLEGDIRHALACLEGEFLGSGDSGVRAMAMASLRRALLRLAVKVA